jgi:hypothetical protein
LGAGGKNIMDIKELAEKYSIYVNERLQEQRESNIFTNPEAKLGVSIPGAYIGIDKATYTWWRNWGPNPIDEWGRPNHVEEEVNDVVFD